MKRTLAVFLSVICVAIAAYTVCLKEIFTPVAAMTEEKFHVVVDAGHGGMDGGVVGRKTGAKESDLNLLISFSLKEILEDAGFLVTMTRKTQFGLTADGVKWSKREDMRKRKEIISESNPSLVISIHLNSYPSSASRGGQVFYLKENQSGKNLALSVQEKINQLYAKDGVKSRVATPSEYYILACSSAPSIIVECGFLSSPKDEALLLTENHRSQIAKSIFAGVMDFYSGEFGA